MKTAHFGVLAAMLSVTACSGTSDEPAPGVASTEAAVSAAASGTEMLIDWQARAELQAALGQSPKGAFDYGNVGVPGVLNVQHQYSVAALRLEARSWSILTGLPTANPGPGSWGVDRSVAVVFPRRLGGTSPAFVSSEQKATALFQAMTAATETTEQVAPNVVATIRTSANGTFRCTRTVSTGAYPRTDVDCMIIGVSEVGGAGLLWQH